MAERSKHLFQFPAGRVAEAASRMAGHHAKRREFWLQEYRRAADAVRRTAKVEIREHAVTGGTRMDLGIDYGDPLAYARMQESWSKAESHRQKAEAYAMDSQVYASQADRAYEMDASDVLHYRLGGGPLDD